MRGFCTSNIHLAKGAFGPVCPGKSWDEIVAKHLQGLVPGGGTVADLHHFSGHLRYAHDRSADPGATRVYDRQTGWQLDNSVGALGFQGMR